MRLGPAHPHRHNTRVVFMYFKMVFHFKEFMICRFFENLSP